MSKDHPNSQPAFSDESNENVQVKSASQKINPERKGFFGGWQRFLTRVRLFLPSNISNNLSDMILSLVVILITVVLIGFSIMVFTQDGGSQQIMEIATIPSSPQAAPVSGELTAPGQEEPTEVMVEPIPGLKLTPEEALITAIENQIVEVISGVASGLIQSIAANFGGGILNITISDSWYSLSESEQNDVGQEILQRSQELDFNHLEIIDLHGTLVARNPVVGSEIVIFQRRVFK